MQFVGKLSDVVIGQLPNFWKLWISYVNGSLFSEVQSAEMQLSHTPPLSPVVIWDCCPLLYVPSSTFQLADQPGAFQK